MMQLNTSQLNTEKKKERKKSGIIIRGFAVWCGTEEHISEVLSQQNLEYCSDILRCL